MVFLMETILPSYRLEKIRVKLGFNHVFRVDCVGRSGGLALLWSEDCNVKIQNYSRRHINVVIKTNEIGHKWKFTGFYSNPDVGKRHESWSFLKYLKSLSPQEWLCVRDFNEIVEETKKLGGKRQSRR